MNKDFRNYAVHHLGMNGLALDQYASAAAQQITSSYISPTIIEERQLNVAQMDVFSRLMMDRIIFLSTDVNDYTATVVQGQLLYDTMQHIKSDVSTICIGMAASMAAVLLVAGAQGKRLALPHSRVMIHQPLGGVQGQASDIEITAREILKYKAELYRIIADHSGMSLERIEADADRDYWMTAQEAKEYGMIDNVLLPEKK